MATLAGLFSTDAETSTAALERFIDLTTRVELPARDRYLALGYNSVVPPHVPPGASDSPTGSTTRSCSRP